MVAQAEAARSGLKAALSAATSTVAEARAKQTTAKDALQVATATVGEARAAVNLAKDKFAMAENLLKQQIGAISQLNYDKAQQNFKEAQATLNVDLDTETKARAAVETAFESVQVAVANRGDGTGSLRRASAGGNPARNRQRRESPPGLPVPDRRHKHHGGPGRS